MGHSIIWLYRYYWYSYVALDGMYTEAHIYYVGEGGKPKTKPIRTKKVTQNNHKQQC